MPYGTWIETASLIGPYGAGGAPTELVKLSAAAIMQPFDGAFSADSGDLWANSVLGTHTFRPLILAPGQSGSINIAITPDQTQVGKTVSGFLYIDSYSDETGTGDEIVRFPYRYTIAR